MTSKNSKLITSVEKVSPNKNSFFLHLNKKGTIKNVSEEFTASTGYKKNDLIGKHISEIFCQKKGIHIEKLIQ